MNNKSHLIDQIKYSLDSHNLSSANINIQKLQKIDPNNIDSIFLMAQLYFLQKDYEKAIVGFNQCLDLYPDNLDLLRRKIYALAKIKDYARAKKLIELFSNKQKLDSELLFILGTCFTKHGDADGAIKTLIKAISNPEHDPLAELSLGHALKADSQVELAEQHYRNFIGSTENKGNGYWAIADLKNDRLNNNDRIKILAYTETSTNKPDVSLAHFALGKSFEDNKQYSKAFQHWRIANQIQQEIRPFKSKSYQLLIENLKQISKSDIISNNTLQLTDRTPIFIVGMPRSGSTLVEQILTSNTLISATDELPFFEQLNANFERCSGINYNLKKIQDEQIIKIQKDYLKSIEHYQESGKLFFIDKNPNNFMHIATIVKTFPNAKIINVHRKPIDNAVSMFRQYFFKGHDFSFSFDSIIEYWHGYIDIMSHWNSILENKVYHLSYEQLVQCFDNEVYSLMQYLSIEYQPQMKQFYNNRRTILTPSVSQVTKPLYRSSIGYQENFKKDLAPYLDKFEALDIRVKKLIKYETTLD